MIVIKIVTKTTRDWGSDSNKNSDYDRERVGVNCIILFYCHVSIV
jgi:hypothetical protein